MKKYKIIHVFLLAVTILTSCNADIKPDIQSINNFYEKLIIDHGIISNVQVSMNDEGFSFEIYVDAAYGSLELDSIYKDSKKFLSNTIISNEIIDLYHKKFRKNDDTIYQQTFPVIRIYFILKNDDIKEYYYEAHYELYNSENGSVEFDGYTNWLGPDSYYF